MFKHAVLMFTGVLIWGTSAWGQAAVEYGMAASKAGVTAAKVGSTLGKVESGLSEQTGTRLAKSLDAAMQDNRQGLELKSQKGGAVLHVASVPDKAVVSIDGMMVARTPADLHIPIGAHVVEIKHASYLPWRKQVTLVDGRDVSLKAQLQEKYRSTVNLNTGR